MATYTITTSAQQEALVSFIVSEYNREHDTTFTNAQYITMRFAALIEPFVARYQELGAQALKTAYASAGPSVQQQVNELLGIP